MIQTNGTAELIQSYPDFDLYEVRVKDHTYRTCENKTKVTSNIPAPECRQLNHMPVVNKVGYKKPPLNVTYVEHNGVEMPLPEACAMVGHNHKNIYRLMSQKDILFADAVQMQNIENSKSYLTSTEIRRKYKIYQRAFDRLLAKGLPGHVYGTKNRARFDEAEVLQWAADNGQMDYFKGDL